MPDRPAILIGVEGGVADYTIVGDIDVTLIDWDNVSDDPDYAAGVLLGLQADSPIVAALNSHSVDELEKCATHPEFDPDVVDLIAQHATKLRDAIVGRKSA